MISSRNTTSLNNLGSSSLGFLSSFSSAMLSSKTGSLNSNPRRSSGSSLSEVEFPAGAMPRRKGCEVMAPGRVYRALDVVTVRAGASLSSPVVQELAKDDLVQALTSVQGDGRFQVLLSDGREGWASAKTRKHKTTLFAEVEDSSEACKTSHQSLDLLSFSSSRASSGPGPAVLGASRTTQEDPVEDAYSMLLEPVVSSSVEREREEFSALGGSKQEGISTTTTAGASAPNDERGLSELFKALEPDHPSSLAADVLPPVPQEADVDDGAQKKGGKRIVVRKLRTGGRKPSKRGSEREEEPPEQPAGATLLSTNELEVEVEVAVGVAEEEDSEDFADDFDEMPTTCEEGCGAAALKVSEDAKGSRL